MNIKKTKGFLAKVDLILWVFNSQYNLFYPPYLKYFLIQTDFFFYITNPYSFVVHHIPKHHT